MIPDGWQRLHAEADRCRRTFGPVWRPSLTASPTRWSESFETAIRDSGGSLTILDPDGAGVTNFTAEDVDRMLACLRSWKSIHSPTTGYTTVTIVPGLEFGIFHGWPFFRVLGSAYATMTSGDVERVKEKIRWTTCPCCERKVLRTRLLKTYEERARWYDPPEYGDD